MASASRWLLNKLIKNCLTEYIWRIKHNSDIGNWGFDLPRPTTAMQKCQQKKEKSYRIFASSFRWKSHFCSSDISSFWISFTRMEQTRPFKRCCTRARACVTSVLPYKTTATIAAVTHLAGRHCQRVCNVRILFHFTISCILYSFYLLSSLARIIISFQ